MEATVTELLDELAARLDCDVLEDKREQKLDEQFSRIPDKASLVAQEIRQLATADDAFNFTSDLTAFLDNARRRTLESQRLKDAIQERQSQVSEAQEEFQYLSTGRGALAAQVRQAMEDLEQARSQYDENELKLGILERRMEIDRHEITSLRNQLAELSKSQEVN
ncbi:MAG TPA: hypothetical protein VGC66_17790 [Pyrinomonadaceae bacterium]